MRDYEVRWATVEKALDKSGCNPRSLEKVRVEVENVLNALDRLGDRAIEALMGLRDEGASEIELLEIGLAARRAANRAIDEYRDLETVLTARY